MSNRPQGDEIDQELRRAMADIATVPEPAPEFDELFSPTLTLEGDRTMKTNNGNLLIAAAAAIVAVVIGVVLLAPSDDSGLETIDSPDGPPYSPAGRRPGRRPSPSGHPLPDPSASGFRRRWPRSGAARPGRAAP